MAVLCASLMLWFGAVSEVEGRLLHLYGSGFSFQIIEPDGWTLDSRAAPQIANFIFHPRGVDWRRAETLIITRFVSRRSSESVEDFISRSRQEFLESCPFADDEKQLHLDSVEPFTLQVYHCPGVRKEVVASAPFAGYFVVFALSAREDKGIESALPVLRRILQSFRWFDSPRLPREPPPDRPDEDRSS